MKPPSKPLKILVLDDDADVLDMLKRILTLNGFTAETSSTARDAVARVEKEDYDFVLVDYKMPENDGIWFMENARIPRTTRVLLITAYVNRQVVNRMFKLGACGYLIKPFDEEELLRSLRFFST